MNIQNFFMAMLLILGIWQNLIAAPNNLNDPAKNILQGINDYRMSQGLTPLIMHPIISQIAKRHSQEMADNKMPLGHQGFNQRSNELFHQLKSCWGFAENVAYLYTNPQDVVALWLNSAGHRKNIEGHYNLTGIGLAQQHNKIYVTQIFVLACEQR